MLALLPHLLQPHPWGQLNFFEFFAFIRFRISTLAIARRSLLSAEANVYIDILREERWRIDRGHSTQSLEIARHARSMVTIQI